jgi:putative heme iron utilization protein
LWVRQVDMALDELDHAQREFVALRESSRAALLATIADARMPCASYAPLVWVDDCCYLYLSDLASHTRNLKRCPAISFLLMENEDGIANAFARRRITFAAIAVIVEREDPLFARVLAEFRQRFGKVMDMIEPLPDFHLFRLQLQSGRFVRGFGQAYELSGDQLNDLTHIGPGKN